MRHLGFKRFAHGAFPAFGVLALSISAQAEEPRKVTEPSVLRESAEITSVADAFDDDDSFDLHLTLGFQQTWKSGNIQRESNSLADQFSSGNFVASNMNVAKYTETTSRLNTRAEVGIYKDIALVLRLPVILSNNRKLEAINSNVPQSVVLQGLPGEQLFSLPFQSPTRGGIEYLAVGLNVDAMNQQRDRTKPTWLIGIEGRFNVSEPMHACSKNAPLNQTNGQVSCAYPSDVNRDGVGRQMPGPPGGPDYLDGTNFSGGRKEGVSRGTTGLEAHTYISKRTKYVEPYGGFSALFEFQNASSDYGQTDLQGSLVNHPPFRGTLVGGIAVIPWEIRDQFQRVELDFRASGTYVTEGRDYSPLFDALGASDAPSLRRPNFASFQDNPNTASAARYPSVIDPTSQKVYVTGLTDMQQHGIYTFSTQLTFQAGEYVKFNVGGAFTAEQGHFITFDQPCNPDVNKTVGTAGPCSSTSTDSTGAVSTTATGVPNPNYRPVINTPGRRFRADDATLWDAWINAIVMF